jgi:hypothetical protein
LIFCDIARQVRRRMQMDGFIDGKPAGQKINARYLRARLSCNCCFWKCFLWGYHVDTHSLRCLYFCNLSKSRSLHSGKYSGKWLQVLKVVWQEEGLRGM